MNLSSKPLSFEAALPPSSPLCPPRRLGLRQRRQSSPTASHVAEFVQVCGSSSCDVVGRPVLVANSWRAPTCSFASLFVCWLVCFFSRCPHFRRGKWERGERRRRRGRAGEGVARARRRNGAEGREIERPTSPLALSSLPVLRRQKKPETALSPRFSLSLPPSLILIPQTDFPVGGGNEGGGEGGWALSCDAAKKGERGDGGRERGILWPRGLGTRLNVSWVGGGDSPSPPSLGLPFFILPPLSPLLSLPHPSFLPTSSHSAVFAVHSLLTLHRHPLSRRAARKWIQSSYQLAIKSSLF